MGIGARQSKRTDPRHPTLTWPGHANRRNLHRNPLPRNLWVERATVNLRGNVTMLKRQNHFDQPDDTSRRFQMTQIGLGRSNHERNLTTTKDCVQRLDFDRIAQRRTGPMRLDIGHRIRLDFGIGQCLPNQRLLRKTIRHSQTAAGTILVHSRPAQDRQNRVAVVYCIAQTLQNHDPTPFSAPVAICIRRKYLATTICRQSMALRKRDKRGGGQNQVDSASQSCATFAGP